LLSPSPFRHRFACCRYNLDPCILPLRFPLAAAVLREIGVIHRGSPLSSAIVAPSPPFTCTATENPSRPSLLGAQNCRAVCALDELRCWRLSAAHSLAKKLVVGRSLSSPSSFDLRRACTAKSPRGILLGASCRASSDELRVAAAALASQNWWWRRPPLWHHLARLLLVPFIAVRLRSVPHFLRRSRQWGSPPTARRTTQTNSYRATNTAWTTMRGNAASHWAY
jgi:hypothetical protein